VAGQGQGQANNEGFGHALRPDDEHERIPIQAFFPLWRFRGAVFVDKVPGGGRLGGHAVQIYCARGLSRGGCARLGPSSVTHRKWRTLLRIYIGPCLCLLVPTSGGAHWQRALLVPRAACFLLCRLLLLSDLWRRQPGSISLSSCPLVADRASFFNGKSCDPVSLWAIQVAVASSSRDLGATRQV
jgi:hypothetical protein